MDSTQHSPQGLHQYSYIRQVIAESKLHRDKYWDGNGMFVTMPNKLTSAYLTRDLNSKPATFFIEPAEPTAQTAKALYEMLGIQSGTPYTTQEIGQFLTTIAAQRSNQLFSTPAATAQHAL